MDMDMMGSWDMEMRKINLSQNKSSVYHQYHKYTRDMMFPPLSLVCFSFFKIKKQRIIEENNNVKGEKRTTGCLYGGAIDMANWELAPRKQRKLVRSNILSLMAKRSDQFP